MQREIRYSRQETLDETTEVVSELTDGTRLVRRDDGSGVVLPPHEDMDATIFQSWNDARLFYGLWMETGGFTTGESPTQQIPIDVVREGKDAVAAYLLVGSGVKNSREYVAKQLNVSKQTVSNYANRIRWSE